jgi:Na+/melibiose symporter-like transporter
MKYSIITLLRYCILGIPLAFVALPLNLNIADFYFRNFQLDLATIAIILLMVRIFDLVSDPFIAICCDYLLGKKNISPKLIINLAGIGLIFGFFILFNPHYFVFFNKKSCLIIGLMLTYFCFNIIAINFEAMAMFLANNNADRIRVNTYKELAILLGILLASSSPLIFAKFVEQQYFYLSLVFTILLLITMIALPQIKINIHQEKINFFITLKQQKFTYLLVILLINGIATAMPASILLFYVTDFLQQQKMLPIFLGSYFLSAIFFMPLWKNLLNKEMIRGINIWIIAIIGAVITFICTFFLQPQQYLWFLPICLACGLFLGADLIMPPAIIANLVGNNNNNTSSYVACYNIVNKIAILLASFVALNALHYYNNILPVIYALLPCILKIIVAIMLQFYKKILKKLLHIKNC